MMANNLKEIRLAFMLTPAELAARAGIDVGQIELLEAADRPLDEAWVDAFSRSLAVPAYALTDPSADIGSIVARASRSQARPVAICHIAARYAILAMVAKFGGLRMANALDDDALATAVANVISYVEADEEAAAGEIETRRANRLSLALQITVLTILQSRGFVPDPAFPQAMEKALSGATAMLREFSHAPPRPATLGSV